MGPLELLDDIGATVAARRLARARDAEVTAPDFTPLDFLDTHERGLSRIIAWLLDPRGSHAQGVAFLAEFTRWLDLEDGWRVGLDGARVIVEAPTRAGRVGGYVDVLVRLRGRVLALENKPKAIDQPGQVRRYLEDLAGRGLDAHCLLYLSGSGQNPSPASIDEAALTREVAAGTLRVRGYADLTGWLAACVAGCRAPSVVHMLEGIDKYIRREFAGVTDIEEATALTEAIIGSAEKLDAALALFEAEARIKARIIADVVEQVAEGAQERRGWRILRDDLGPRRHSALVVGFSPSASVGFGIQFDRTEHRWPFYGVNSLDGRPLPRGVKLLLQNLIGATASTDAWPVWKQVGPNDRFFPLPKETSREFWQAARDGSLARMILGLAAEMEAALRDAKLLTAVRERTIAAR